MLNAQSASVKKMGYKILGDCISTIGWKLNDGGTCGNEKILEIQGFVRIWFVSKPI